MNHQHQSLPAIRMTASIPTTNTGIALVKEDATGSAYLVATKSFERGQEVFQFWSVAWPQNSQGDLLPIDLMIYEKDKDFDANDEESSTTIRVEPLEHGRADDVGQLRFTGINMLTVHSCHSNIAYSPQQQQTQQRQTVAANSSSNHQVEGDAEAGYWQSAYASRTLLKGEKLSVDYNSLFWDRSNATECRLTRGTCHCKTSQCRQTNAGFAHLAPEYQDELKVKSWFPTVHPGIWAGGLAPSIEQRLFDESETGDGSDENYPMIMDECPT